MKTAVIYTSQTGFTKRYANWIADSMNADIFDLKDVQKKDAAHFAGYDAIVYAGWLCAEKVVKVNWFFEKAGSWKDKKLALVCVGGSPNGTAAAERTIESILPEEYRDYIRAFYCQGGFNYDKMNMPSKIAMKMFAGMLKNKKDATDEIKEMAERVSHSYDIADRKFTEPVVDYLLGNSAEEGMVG